MTTNNSVQAYWSHEHYVSGHQLLIEVNGEVVDAYSVCSDQCHRDLAHKMSVPYNGWNGCNELQAPQYCENCHNKI